MLYFYNNLTNLANFDNKIYNASNCTSPLKYTSCLSNISAHA